MPASKTYPLPDQRETLRFRRSDLVALCAAREPVDRPGTVAVSGDELRIMVDDAVAAALESVARELETCGLGRSAAIVRRRVGR